MRRLPQPAGTSFELPERALNREMQFGGIPVTLPFIKKTSTEVLKAEYTTSEEAARKIPEAIKSFYATSYPAVAQSRAADIQQAANTVLAIYNRNVFPELKVSWGTYANNLGHTDFPGCFRCHDREHGSSAVRKTPICRTAVYVTKNGEHLRNVSGSPEDIGTGRSDCGNSEEMIRLRLIGEHIDETILCLQLCLRSR